MSESFTSRGRTYGTVRVSLPQFAMYRFRFHPVFSCCLLRGLGLGLGLDNAGLSDCYMSNSPPTFRGGGGQKSAASTSAYLGPRHI